MCAEVANVPVLAIYDFRSKQEFIYRTNRMREITGASELLADLYDMSLRTWPYGGAIRNDWQEAGRRDVLDDKGQPTFADDEVGIVVYEGGGNLCILYRSRDWCTRATRFFSRMVLDVGYTLSLVMGSVEWVSTGSPDRDFEAARSRAYRALDINKRLGQPSNPCNVLPFTQVDAVTFQAIVEKGRIDDDEYERSAESVLKLEAYERRAKRPAKGELPGQWERQGKNIDDIGTAKDDDSLIAVVVL